MAGWKIHENSLVKWSNGKVVEQAGEDMFDYECRWHQCFHLQEQDELYEKTVASVATYAKALANSLSSGGAPGRLAVWLGQDQ